MKKASIVYENTLSLSFMCSLRGREGRSQTELFSTNESEGYCSQIWSGYIGSWSDAWWPKSMLLLPKCVKENWQEQELKRWWTKLQQSRKTVLLSNLRLLLKPCCWSLAADAHIFNNNRYDCQDLEILHINGTKISLSHCSLSHTHASCSSPCVPSH